MRALHAAGARSRAASFDATGQAHHALLSALQRSSPPWRAPYGLRRSRQRAGRAGERWRGLGVAWSCLYRALGRPVGVWVKRPILAGSLLGGRHRGVADLPGPDSRGIAGRKRALAHFLDRRPTMLRRAGERRSSRGEQRSHGRQPGGRDLHQGLLRASGEACSDEPAHGQPSARACYLGWTTSELLSELADARVAVVDQSKQHSHLSGGVLTALEHPEHTVECRVSPGHRRVATGWTLLLCL